MSVMALMQSNLPVIGLVIGYEGASGARLGTPGGKGEGRLGSAICGCVGIASESQSGRCGGKIEVGFPGLPGTNM